MVVISKAWLLVFQWVHPNDFFNMKPKGKRKSHKMRVIDDGTSPVEVLREGHFPSSPWIVYSYYSISIMRAWICPFRTSTVTNLETISIMTNVDVSAPDNVLFLDWDSEVAVIHKDVFDKYIFIPDECPLERSLLCNINRNDAV